MTEIALISIRVTPKAARTRLTALKDGVFWVSVAAPPIEGRANEALIEFLSRCLGVPKGTLDIKRGESGRIKIVEVDGLAPDEAEIRLRKHLP
ncbi:MAG: DUF167 domain-containing protein [Dehalococcoidia bacterium]|nr:DUF167 domain-containing protein [Dehalococcoidia bacterium]